MILNEKYVKFCVSKINEFFESERHNLPNFIPVAIGIGICSYFYLNNEPSFLFSCGFFSLSLLLFIFFTLKKRKYEKSEIGNYEDQLCEENNEKNQQNDINNEDKFFSEVSWFYIANFFITALFLISFGFLLSQLRTRYVNTFMLTEDIKNPISFSAVIESCEKTEKGMKFIVANIRRKYDDESGKLCKKFNKLHLIWIGKTARESTIDYLPGTRVLFRALLSPIRAKSFPGAYDFKKQQYFRGISARGFILKAPKILPQYKYPTITNYINQQRYKINKTLEKYLTKNTAAIAKALTTGNTSGITKAMRANFANSGTAHLLAISGLHIGIIGFFIFWLFRVVLCFIPLISMFYDTKKIAAVASLIFVFIYLQISGCSVSSIRAFIMHTIIVIAILLNRTAFTMRSVATAATVIMLYSPEVIMFPSFQMSFGAVIAIISFVEYGIQVPDFLKWLSEVIIVTVIASLPTSIISVAVFNQLTLNSILANVICIPLMTFFIMPILMFALFFMIFGLAKPFILLSGIGIDLLMKITEKTSQLPWSFFVMPSPNDLIFGIIIISFLFLTLIQHNVRILGAFGMLFGLMLYFRQPLPDIFIAPYAKIVGIKTPDCVCFSNLNYFRSMNSSWSKFIGFEKRENFESKACRKWIEKDVYPDKTIYIANLKGKTIKIIKNHESGNKNNLLNENCNNKNKDEDFIFKLNQENNEFAEMIYLNKNTNQSETVSTKNIKRPWS